MDRETAAAYENQAAAWIERRRPEWLTDGRFDAFAARLPAGARVADLGCGPGWYAEALRARGAKPIALDLSRAMLADAARRAPEVPRVRADLRALPFARASLDGAWAIKCYQHLPLAELPAALAALRRALRAGAAVLLTLSNLEASEPTPSEREAGFAERRFADDDLPGRLFTLLDRSRALRLVESAGFEVLGHEAIGGRNGFWHWLPLACARGGA